MEIKLDNPIMRVMDLLFTFPSILLAMLIIAMLGVNAFNTMLAISVCVLVGGLGALLPPLGPEARA